jgi:hypothetical protein
MRNIRSIRYQLAWLTDNKASMPFPWKDVKGSCLTPVKSWTGFISRSKNIAGNKPMKTIKAAIKYKGNN